MKCSLIVLLLLFLRVPCSTLARSNRTALQPLPCLEDPQTELEQERSARVHRIAENGYPEGSYAKDAIDEVPETQKSSLGRQKLEKLLVDLPNQNELIQREVELFEELKTILKELSREGSTALKDIDLAINGIADTSMASTFIKSASKNIRGLKKLLGSPEELDIYYPDGQNVQKQAKSRSPVSQEESTSNLESKTMQTIVQYLNKVLMDLQNRIIYVRNVLQKLCREHQWEL